MALSRREKALVLVLPAVAVVGAYVYFIALPQYKKTGTSVKTLQGLQAKSAGPNHQAQLMAVIRDLDKETADFALVKARWERCMGTGNGAISRPERIEKLNGLFHAAGLTVHDGVDAESAKGDHKMTVPASLTKPLADLAGLTHARPRVVTFTGGYPQVLATMDRLAKCDLPAIPLALTMKAGKINTTQREWTLLIWV